MDDLGPSKGGIELAPGVSIAPDGLRVQFSRGGGPGGQNVNKVNTRVEIWVEVGQLRGMGEDALQRLRTLAGSRLTRDERIHIVAEEHRSQAMNRSAAMERLRDLLVRAMHRPRRRKPTKPGRGWHRVRLDEKRRRGGVKADRRQVLGE